MIVGIQSGDPSACHVDHPSIRSSTEFKAAP